MLCAVCNSSVHEIFKADILSKYHVTYYCCSVCGFVQTEEPYWLAEAYQHTINDEDTMVLQRNWYFADVVSSVLFSLFNRQGGFLDFGGGHGVFARLMRDKGFDFYWHDPKAKNIFSRGFEYAPEKGAVELITCIECFEHFSQPKKELETMLGISSNVFFTTQLLPSPVPKPEEWEYYGLTHGQHIAFYSMKTLRYLANLYGLYVYTNGVNMHLFTKKTVGNYKFRKAIHPGVLQRLRIKKAMKSRFQTDYEYIVRKKKGKL